jgi:hypothetical protein
MGNCPIYLYKAMIFIPISLRWAKMLNGIICGENAKYMNIFGINGKKAGEISVLGLWAKFIF